MTSQLLMNWRIFFTPTKLHKISQIKTQWTQNGGLTLKGRNYMANLVIRIKMWCTHAFNLIRALPSHPETPNLFKLLKLSNVLWRWRFNVESPSKTILHHHYWICFFKLEKAECLLLLINPYLWAWLRNATVSSSYLKLKNLLYQRTCDAFWLLSRMENLSHEFG